MLVGLKQQYYYSTKQFFNLQCSACLGLPFALGVHAHKLCLQTMPSQIANTPGRVLCCCQQTTIELAWSLLKR